MTAETIQPLYSAFEGDLEMQDDLARFVVGLAEDIDRIQDAEHTGLLSDVTNRARRLAQRAQHFGYGILSELANQVATAGEDDKPEAVQEHLRALTHVACRVRRGHRGAAS